MAPSVANDDIGRAKTSATFFELHELTVFALGMGVHTDVHGMQHSFTFFLLLYKKNNNTAAVAHLLNKIESK